LIAAVLCSGTWKFLQLLIDARTKAADKIAKKSLEISQTESELRLSLLSSLRQLAEWKTAQVVKQLLEAPAKKSLSHIRQALTPKPHLEDILSALIQLLTLRMPGGLNTTANIRIGIYLDLNGTLTPCAGANRNNATANPFSSFAAYPNQFKVDGVQKTSNAVKSIQQKKTFITEDCEKASLSGEFHFLHENQKSYLKSLFAYYICEVYDICGRPVQAVMLIDTDLPGFFKETDLEEWKVLVREYVSRIKLELALLALLQPRAK
jgi:hypothetical protein